MSKLTKRILSVVFLLVGLSIALSASVYGITTGSDIGLRTYVLLFLAVVVGLGFVGIGFITLTEKD